MGSIATEQLPPLSPKPPILQSETATREPHENEWYRQSFDGYTVKEQSLYTKRPLRMIIIGAGAAGLQIAYKAERQLENVSFQIYEKNNEVGGTWLENRYPGCTCDIPSHSYQWSFWRNPKWSSYYSGAAEIWQYLKDFAVVHDLEKFVAFEHKVQEAKWNEAEGVWEVTIQKPNGEVFVDSGEILASCHGVLNTWKLPDIPGIQKYKGKMMHSAAWDSSYNLTDKTVAVIGGGSSAVQIIPSIQPNVKKLVPYLRSSVWITGGFGAKFAAPGGVNFKYTEDQKESFKNDPEGFNNYCRDVEGELNRSFTLMHLNSVDQKQSREYVATSMKEKLSNDHHLAKHLVPDYALGCRRMTPGSDYLQSLTRDNVEVITDSATAFTEGGVIDGSGKETKAEVIICATGFETTKPSYNIIGRDNRNLGEEWGEFPKAYMSIMSNGFPNLFCFIGPNGPGSHGSILPVIEWHTRYMFKVISHIQRTCIKALSPKASVSAELSTHTHELLRRTAWSSSCSSWFKNGKRHGPVTAIWPGSRMHWFESLKEPRYEDFDMEYTGNRFTYLGNGYADAELRSEANLVWYFDLLRKELELGKKAFDVHADVVISKK